MSACIVCDNREVRPLYRFCDMEIVRCAGCGLAFREGPVSAQGLYTSAYFKSSDPLASGYGDYAGDRENLMRTFRRRFKEILKSKKKGAILDIGCAMGFFLCVANEHGWEAKGVEASEFAASFAKDNFSFEIFPSVKEAGFPRESFDVITMWDYLEHISDPLGELRDCRALLREGGLLFMTIPDIGSVASRVFKGRWIGIKKEHVFYFSLKTIKRLLDKSGFRIVSSGHAGKYMRIAAILERAQHYNPALGYALGKLLPVRARNGSLYVNGFDILRIVARKR